jgi:hypothetical protein
MYFHDDGLKFPIFKSKAIVAKYFSKLLWKIIENISKNIHMDSTNLYKICFGKSHKFFISWKFFILFFAKN